MKSEHVIPCKNKKKPWKKKKFKLSALTWNENFEIPHGSYPVSDIQDYFKYIIKKYETVAYNPPIRI